MSYFENHPSYREKSLKDLPLNYLKFKYHDFINRKDFEKNILEIGFGEGKFASYAYDIGLKNYTGIDIDKYFLEENRKSFPGYDFFCTSIYDLNNVKYDIIITEHLFEHLDSKEREKFIQKIYSLLKNEGRWINIMPNASAVVGGTFARYGDITHKTIYNDISFEQIIRTALFGISKKGEWLLKHYNAPIGTNFIKRILHGGFKFLTKIYYSGMGFVFPNIYTYEIFSVFEKGKN